MTDLLSDAAVMAPAKGLLSDADMMQPERPALAPQTRTESFVQGLRDPIDAGAQMLTHALPEGWVAGINSGVKATNDLPYIGTFLKSIGFTPATTQQIDQDVASRRTPEGDGHDWWRTAGNVVGTAPLALASPAATTLRGAAAIGGITGAASGALEPVTKPTDGFWSTKGQQAATGAATGAIAGPVIQQASRVIQPRVSEAVQTLIDRGVYPTPGQVLGGTAARAEEKLTSLPFVGDVIRGGQRQAIEQFNQSAFNDALKPIGEKYTGKLGREAVEEVGDRIGAHYDKLLPGLTFKADTGFGQDLMTIGQKATGLAPPQQEQFQNLLKTKVFPRIGGGTMDGETLKGLESELGGIIKGYRSDPSFDNRQMGGVLDDVLTAIRSNLQRTNPDKAIQLAAANSAWAKFVRLRDAAARIGSDEGVFTPAQLQSAVRAGDASMGKGQFARGQALMQDLSEAGKTVLGSKYPDSGTAGRYMLGALAGGGAGAIPLLLGGGAAMLPYSKAGQALTALMLTQRPTAVTAPLAAALRKASPALTAGIQSALPAQRGP